MRMSTFVYGVLENKGKPNDSLMIEGDVRTVIKEIAKWIIDTSMQNRMVITLARNKEGLLYRDTPNQDLMTELEDMLKESLDGDMLDSQEK